MKSAEVAALVSLLLFPAIVGGIVLYSEGHSDGYWHGVSVTMEYQEAMGEWPTERWLNKYERRHLPKEDDPLDQPEHPYEPHRR